MLFNLVLSIPYHQGKTLRYYTQCCESLGFQLVWWEWALVRPVGMLAAGPPVRPAASSLVSDGSLQECTDLLSWAPRPPSSALLFPVLCPVNPAPSHLSALPPQLREAAGLLLGSPLCAMAWKRSQKSKVSAGVCLTARVPVCHRSWPSLLDVQSLRRWRSLVVLGRRVNLVLATPFQLKTDVWSVLIIQRVRLLICGCQSCFVAKCRLWGDMSLYVADPAFQRRVGEGFCF